MLHVPPRELMVATNDEDPVAYYYRPVIGRVYRARLRLALGELDRRRGHVGDLLEVGYGSGILLPELAGRCDRLAGVDLHEQLGPVRAMLAKEGVAAELATGSILALPYEDRSFDAVACLSVLEHMEGPDLPHAVGELRRVLRPGGIVVAGFPVRNLVTGAFFRSVGLRPDEIHPSSHRDIARAIESCFGNAHARRWPGFLPTDLAAYVVCTATRGRGADTGTG